MNRLNPAPEGDGDDFLHIQVGFGGRLPTQRPSFVGHQDVGRGGVRVRIYGNRSYAQCFQRLLHPDGNLTPVGYQYLGENRTASSGLNLMTY
jgi:hypothetical protein